jgi:hypothetical protein
MIYDYLIGIDAGTVTGYAVYNCRTKVLDAVDSMEIHQAMELVKESHKVAKIKVIVEDARFVKYNTDARKAQGAGSVKRDAAIWEGYLRYLGVTFELVRPRKALTKWSADQLGKATGWLTRTNEHGRDAAMLIYGR